MIGVWRSSNGRLSIWGLLHLGEHRLVIDFPVPSPFFFTQIVGVATFQVGLGPRLLGTFVRDHWNPRVNAMDLFETLRARAAMEPRIAVELCLLTRRMLEHRHGGTILVIDTAVAPRGLIFHRSYSSRVRNPLLSDAVDAHMGVRKGQGRPPGISDGRWIEERINSRRAHEQALDFVARLTAVDGAVLMGLDLSVFGFGVSISTDNRKPIPVVVENPAQRRMRKNGKVTDFAGQRHRSAIHFCAQQKGLALALVASQDGSVSFFANRRDGRVSVIRPYEAGVGI